MGIFQRITKSQPNVAAAKEAGATKVEGVVEETTMVVAPGTSTPLAILLESPRVSEKAAILASKGVYVFNVPVKANKVEIRKAVEASYKVHVTDVRTSRGIGKVVRRGRTSGVRNRWKKAMVSVKAGEKIELYKGV